MDPLSRYRLRDVSQAWDLTGLFGRHAPYETAEQSVGFIVQGARGWPEQQTLTASPDPGLVEEFYPVFDAVFTPVSPELIKFTEYLHSLTDFVPFRHVEAAKKIWAELMLATRSRIGAPISKLTPTSGIQLTWQTKYLVLDFEVFEDSSFHWFYRDRQDKTARGSEDPVNRLERAVLHFARRVADARKAQ